MNQCVVLNADYSFLNIVDWKRAVCLVVKEKVTVLKWSKKIVGCGDTGTMRIPLVLKLIKIIRTIYRARVPFSKKNVMVRDNFRCAYCGNRPRKLTVDHIIPSSQGGKTNFENCVSACKPCNNLKNNRTPSQAKMFLKVKAYQPTISEFLMKKVRQLGIDGLLKDLGIY
ncbi:MAG: HNH endonuclease [Candidatus Thorarchaeota archaeon]